MKVERILACWTHCYHVTAVVNLRGIRRSRILFPASTLLGAQERGDLLGERRTHDVRIRFREEEVLVRNQAPLNPDHADLSASETFQEYVRCLNSHVFFWPGGADGPISDGVRMLQKAGATSATIRAPIGSLLKANEASRVHLSTCNSGATWLHEGAKCQRGTSIFQPVETFSEHPGQIAEILFRGSVNLPGNCEYRIGAEQRWSSLLARQNGIAQSPSKDGP